MILILPSCILQKMNHFLIIIRQQRTGHISIFHLCHGSDLFSPTLNKYLDLFNGIIHLTQLIKYHPHFILCHFKNPGTRQTGQSSGKLHHHRLFSLPVIRPADTQIKPD